MGDLPHRRPGSGAAGVSFHGLRIEDRVGNQITQRLQYERALQDLRMRDGQIVGFYLTSVPPEDIYVDHSRGPPPMVLPPQGTLDLLDVSQESAGLEGRLPQERTVQIG